MLHKIIVIFIAFVISGAYISFRTFIDVGQGVREPKDFFKEIFITSLLALLALITIILAIIDRM